MTDQPGVPGYYVLIDYALRRLNVLFTDSTKGNLTPRRRRFTRVHRSMCFMLPLFRNSGCLFSVAGVRPDVHSARFFETDPVKTVGTNRRRRPLLARILDGARRIGQLSTPQFKTKNTYDDNKRINHDLLDPTGSSGAPPNQIRHVDKETWGVGGKKVGIKG